MSLTNTEFNDALKDYYTDERVEEVQYRDRPLLAYLAKFEKFGGRKLPIPIQFGDPQAISASFSVAQTRASGTSSQIDAFELTRVKLYGIANIDTETMEASEGNEAAWFDARTNEINNQIEGVSNVLAQSLYRSGWGDVGVIGSISGSTITLATLSDIHGIEVGQVHVLSSSLNAAVLRNSGTTITVSGVNRNTGVITYSAGVVATIAAAANGDTIFLNGCRQDSATPTMLMPAGLEAWCPSGGASATAFFNVVRTQDSRLAGVSYNGTADAPEDAIIETANRMASLGRKATHAFVSFGQFSKIVKAQRLLERFRDTMTATVGFEGVIILGSKGPIKLIPDQYCPATRAFVLDLPATKLYSLKKAVRVIDNDGNMVLRQSDGDGVQVRVGFKGNLGCKAPTGIGNVQLTAA